MRDWTRRHAVRPRACDIDLLDVVTDRDERVMPSKIEVTRVFGPALYSVKGVPHGRAKEDVDLIDGAIVN